MGRLNQQVLRVLGFFAVFLCTLTLSGLNAQAACTTPPGDEGVQVYNPTYKTMQFCNGTDWVSMGSIAPGSGGGGSGGSSVGGCYLSENACTPGFTQMPGTASLSSTTHNICCALAGVPLLAGDYDTTPGTVSFASYNAYTDGFEISNIELINSISSAEVSINGPQTEEYRLCNDSTCSSVTQDWTNTANTIQTGQYVQMRVNSSATGNVVTNLIVGTETYPWSMDFFSNVTGEQLFTSSGTFTVPAGVIRVSTVCVGGGGGGSNGNTSTQGGGGGGLVWKNNIAVSPAQNIPIVVGNGGNGGSSGSAGGDSSFNTTIIANGGGTNGAAGGSFSGGDGGGNGGTRSGGAGGYTGNGGDAGLAGAGGGGGGGDTGGGNSGGSGGGGVGLSGIGSNGTGSVDGTIGAGGGSGGASGASRPSQYVGGSGGLYGGGGAGGDSGSSNGNGGAGGAGACRIIWGAGRSFPNNAT